MNNIVPFATVLIMFVILERLKIFSLIDFFSLKNRKIDFFDEAGEIAKKEQRSKEELKSRMITRGMRVYLQNINSLENIFKRFGVSTNKFILAGIIWVETRGNSSARGKAGEIGLMQITKNAVTDVDNEFKTNFITPPRGVLSNIVVAALYLDIVTKKMGGDTFAGLRAYNCGVSGAKRDVRCGKDYATNVLNFARFIQMEF